MSCEQEETPEPVRTIPELVQPHVDRFILEAERRGVSLDISKLSFEFELGLTIPNQGLAIASCTRTEDLHLVKIDTSNVFWVHGGPMGQEEVVFHELGHCLLQRPHKEDRLATDDFRSIMRAQGALSYGSFNTFLQSSMVHRRDYYLDELFNENTPAPCWAVQDPAPPFPQQIFDEDFLNAGPHYEMILDGTGSFWLSGQNDMYRFQNGQFEEVPFEYEVNELASDHAGNLWIAARWENKGLLGLWNDGEFEALYEDTEIGGPIFNIYRMTVDHQGMLWFSSVNGEIFRQTEAGDFEQIPDQSDVPVSKMLSSSDGTLYMLKGFEILIFKESLTPQTLSTSNSGLPIGYFRDFAVDNQGVLWLTVAGLKETYLVRIYQDQTVEVLELADLNMPETFINAIWSDSEGNIWLATSNGIKKWEEEYFSGYCTFNTGNPILSPTDIVVDSQGIVWSMGKDAVDSRRKIIRTDTGI